MCTNLLDAWDGNADDLAQNVSLVVVARSPIERLVAVKARARLEEPPARQRPSNGNFARDYVGSPG